MTVLTLSPDQVAELADLVAVRLAERLCGVVADRLTPTPAAPSTGVLVDARTLAATLGTSREFVYRHADELGAVALGNGPKPRVRFDVEVARERMACLASKRSQDDSSNGGGRVATPSRRRAARLPVGVPKPGSILAIRPRERA